MVYQIECPMSSRYGNQGKVVPLHVAQELLEQRDRLVAELQATRRKNDRLDAELRRLGRDWEVMEDRAAASEEEAQALRRELADAKSASPTSADNESDDTKTVERLTDRIQKLTDDMERLRRRSSESVEAARREEQIRLLAGLGEVLDSVERALKMGEPRGPWRQGLEAIRSQLYAYLRGEGATITGEIGEKLDPTIHQAIAAVDDADAESGEIVRVDRPGMVLADGETVVRPAQVVVAK